jgi:hypothetical protein
VDVEIAPEPDAAERAAILAALAEGRYPAEPEAYRSAWRRDGLCDDED